MGPSTVESARGTAACTLDKSAWSQSLSGAEFTHTESALLGDPWLSDCAILREWTIQHWTEDRKSSLMLTVLEHVIWSSGYKGSKFAESYVAAPIRGFWTCDPRLIVRGWYSIVLHLRRFHSRIPIETSWWRATDIRKRRGISRSRGFLNWEWRHLLRRPQEAGATASVLVLPRGARSLLLNAIQWPSTGGQGHARRLEACKGCVCISERKALKRKLSRNKWSGSSSRWLHLELDFIQGSELDWRIVSLPTEGRALTRSWGDMRSLHGKVVCLTAAAVSPARNVRNERETVRAVAQTLFWRIWWPCDLDGLTGWCLAHLVAQWSGRAIDESAPFYPIANLGTRKHVPGDLATWT